MKEQRGISELPFHLMEIIFKELPLISIPQSRLVCKKWKQILSSDYFLSSLLKPDPWLLIFGMGSCMAYCFSTQKWRPISPFFPPSLQADHYCMLSSTALGLLAFRETSSIQNLYLFNPLMIKDSLVKMETSNSIHIVHGRDGKPYLVMMLDEHHPKISFRIYHYFEGSWKIMSEFLEEIEEIEEIEFREESAMVECNGFLFFLIRERPAIIYGFSIEGNCIKPVRIPRLPRQLVEDARKGFYLHIVAYGSSLLLVVSLLLVRRHMVIWELFQDDEDKLLWKWREFARMSTASLTSGMPLDGWSYMCVAVGDYLCFGTLTRDAVATYNLKERSWQLLPKCGVRISEMLSFDPKLIFPDIEQQNGEKD